MILSHYKSYVMQIMSNYLTNQNKFKEPTMTKIIVNLSPQLIKQMAQDIERNKPQQKKQA